MQFSKLFDDDRAVSPVIGVILMVAITVILAAVIGTFVLGLSDQIGDTTPQASFEFDWDAANDQLTVSHESGDTITAADVNVSYGSVNEKWNAFQTSSDAVTDISAGESILINDGSTDGTYTDNVDPSGETVRIIYTNPNSDSSSTLEKFEVPN